MHWVGLNWFIFFIYIFWNQNLMRFYVVLLSTSWTKLFMLWLDKLSFVIPGKAVSKFCAKHLHLQVLKNEAYSSGDLATSVLKSFFRYVACTSFEHEVLFSETIVCLVVLMSLHRFLPFQNGWDDERAKGVEGTGWIGGQGTKVYWHVRRHNMVPETWRVR